MPISYRWDIQKPVCATRENIKQMVCDEFGITVSELCGQERTRIYMDARCVYSYLMRKHLSDTIIRIGIELNKGHPAIINQLKKIEDLIYINDPVKKRIERIEKLLKQQ